MGKINQGVLGGFSGQVGNIVGANWKGIDYIRIKPSNVANPKTTGQVNQRTKFALVLKMLKSITPFIRVGFKLQAVKKTQFNAAMSYNLNNAIEGSSPNFSIDYTKFLVSQGSLVMVEAPVASSDDPETVTVTWGDNSGVSNAKATDKAMMLVYHPGTNSAVFITEGATRDALSQTLQLPSDYAGEEVKVYLSFISEDGKEVASSSFVGSVMVTVTT